MDYDIAPAIRDLSTYLSAADIACYMAKDNRGNWMEIFNLNNIGLHDKLGLAVAEA